MSLKSKYANITNIIRDRLERESRRILSEGGKITPYHIMESLKTKADGDENLTCIGRLIQESLGDRKMIDSVGWVAFHFDFPGKEFSYSEGDMRNWVAVKSDSQGLLNSIYKVVRRDFHRLKDHYAPSILLAQMSNKRVKNANLNRLNKKFQERRWMYIFTDVGNDFRFCLNNNARRAKELNDNEIIFFEEGETPNGRALNLTFWPPVLNSQTDFTLGDLLDETEGDSLRKFNIFRKAIQRFSEDKVPLNCDFYASVPLFFCGTEQEYVSDIYVAFNHVRENGRIVSVLEISEVIRILNDIVPSLKTCVSLINSQVAYSLGEVTRQDKMSGLMRAVIRHDISNFAGAVDGAISQLQEYWELMTAEDISQVLREMRANITLYTMSIDLDFIWGADRQNLSESLTTPSRIREELDKSWRFSTIAGCDFSGGWTEESLVPKICRIILSNLLRNAINNNDDTRIVMDCRAERDKISFGCLSENPISDAWKRRAFDSFLSYEVPRYSRGLWICRHIAESLKGDFYLAPPQGNYKTHIRFDIPSLRIKVPCVSASRQKEKPRTGPASW